MVATAAATAGSAVGIAPRPGKRQQRISLELDQGDSEPEDIPPRKDLDQTVADDSLTARGADKVRKAHLLPRELVELRYLIQRDDRFGRALEKTCHAVHEVVVMGNTAPVLAMLAGLVWHCLCLAWEVDAQGGGVPKATLRARVVKLEEDLQQVDTDWQKARREYFKELCNLREQVRRLDSKHLADISAIVYEEDPVIFYKEIEHLPENTKLHVAEIVEEKLKQLVKKQADGDWAPARAADQTKAEPSRPEEDDQLLDADEISRLRALLDESSSQAKKLGQQLEQQQKQHAEDLGRQQADVMQLARCAIRDRDELIQFAEARGKQVDLLTINEDFFSSQMSPPVPSSRPTSGRLRRAASKRLGGLSAQVAEALEENRVASRDLMKETAGHNDSVSQFMPSVEAPDDASSTTTMQAGRIGELETNLAELRLELQMAKRGEQREKDRCAQLSDEMKEKISKLTDESDELRSQNLKFKAELKIYQDKATKQQADLQAQQQQLQQERQESQESKKTEPAPPTPFDNSEVEELRRMVEQLSRENEDLAAEAGRGRAEVKRLSASLVEVMDAQANMPPPIMQDDGAMTEPVGGFSPKRSWGRVADFHSQRKVFERLFKDSIDREDRRLRLKEVFESAAHEAGLLAFAGSAAHNVASRLGAVSCERRANDKDAESAVEDTANNLSVYDEKWFSRQATAELTADSVPSSAPSKAYSEKIWRRRLDQASKGVSSAGMRDTLFEDEVRGHQMSTQFDAEDARPGQQKLAVNAEGAMGQDNRPGSQHARPFLDPRSSERALRALLSRARVRGGGPGGFHDSTAEQALGLEEFLRNLEEHGVLSTPPRSRSGSPVAGNAFAAVQRRRTAGSLKTRRISQDRYGTHTTSSMDTVPVLTGPIAAQALYLQRLAEIAAQRETDREETAEEVAARWAEALEAMEPKDFPLRVEGLLPAPTLPSDPDVLQGLRSMVDGTWRSPSPQAREVAAAEQACGLRPGSSRPPSARPPSPPARPPSAHALPSINEASAKTRKPPPKRLSQSESEASLNQKAMALLATQPGQTAQPAATATLRRTSSAGSVRRPTKGASLVGSTPIKGAPLAGGVSMAGVLAPAAYGGTPARGRGR